MAATIKHVTLRGATYQYYRRVPQHIIDRPELFEALFGSKAFLRVSLGTKDQAVAMERAAQLEKEFRARTEIALNQQSPEPSRLRPLTAEFLHKVYKARRSQISKPYRNLAILQEVDPSSGEELDRMLEDLEVNAEHYSEVLERGKRTGDPRLDVSGAADGIIRQNNIDAPLGSAARATIQVALRSADRDGLRDAADIALGKVAVLPSLNPIKKPHTDPRLSEVVGEYAKSLTAKRTRVEVQGALKAFIAAVGDLPIDEISKRHVALFCQSEGEKQIGGKSRNSVVRPMSSQTLAKKLGLLRSAINRLTKKMLYDGANPFAGFDAGSFTSKTPAAVMPVKRPFSIDELNKVFEYPWFSGCASEQNIHKPGDHRLSGMHYWGPIMALFTGCRAGELGGLTLDDIMLDAKFPHIRIRSNEFRSTKGSYNRNVPVLDQLLELGFAEFVKRARTSNSKRLFEDWKAPSGRDETDDAAWSNGAMIRSFNQTAIPKILAGYLDPGARREITFHGFRGSFKTLLTRQEHHKIQMNYVHEVVGHEKFHLDARYIGTIPIEETYPAIRGCRYEGLLIPALP